MIKKRFAVMTNGVVKILTNPSEEELKAADQAVSIESVAKFKRIPVHKWNVFPPKPVVEIAPEPVPAPVEIEHKPDVIEPPKCEKVNAVILEFKPRKKRNKLQIAAIVALVAIVCYGIYLGVR